MDRQFRFQEGFCQKNNLPGFNPGFFGECGNFRNKTLPHGKHKNPNLKASIWINSSVDNLKIKGGDISFSNLDRASLTQSSFEEINGDFIGIKRSYLQSVIWKKASLKNLLATASRIRKSQFIECDLRDADFWGANLQETSFEKSDLRGANLQATYLLFTNFKEARFNSKTKLPFSEEEALSRGMVKVD